MSNTEIESKCRELRQLQALIEEAEAEAESIKDDIKNAMGGAEEIRAGEYRVTWKTIQSAKFDLSAFRKAMPDMAAAFTKTATTRRFCVV